MKKKDIFRVAQLCLPKLSVLSSDNDDDDNDNTPHLHDVADMKVSSICSLWSGMGHIYKVELPATAGNHATTLVVKHVGAPRNKPNKELSFGDRRKADSYQVEANFYDKLAPRLIQQHGVRLPTPYLVERDSGKAKNEIVICMSYVESAKDVVSDDDEAVKAVLVWLASLHAAYWGNAAVDALVNEIGLQKLGSYWHLDTRPDEHAAMPSQGWQGRLKRAAKAIDEGLKRDPMQCLIHGDAKDANVLFSRSNSVTADDNNGNKRKSSSSSSLHVTMCDFQYCGKGPPSKDLAYFFTSSVSPDNEDAALEFYLKELTARLATIAAANAKNDTTTTVAPPPPPPSMKELKDSMDLAYCDFYRFMCGWGFWGADSGEDRVQRILNRLDGGKDLGSEEAYDEAIRREYG